MAKVEITKYRCDRCHLMMDQPVRGGERGPTKFELVASEDFGVAGGTPLKWMDLCKSCNSYLGGLLRTEIAAQNAAREATIERED